MADLIDKLGAKLNKGKAAAKKAENVLEGAETQKDLMEVIAPIEPVVTVIEAPGGIVEVKTETKEENTEVHPEWTKEDYDRILKETRNEAAKNRVKAKELESTLDQRLQEKLQEIEEKYAPLKKKAEEFDKHKETEADRKRSLEEKIAHRDRMLSEKDEEIKTLRDEYHNDKVKLQNEAENYKARVNAHESYYKEALERERGEVPQKFQAVADAMIKGASDVKHALELLREAKTNNLFGNKKVVVNHSVPNANNGARLDSIKAQEAHKESMKSSDKIRAGIRDLVSKVKTDRNRFGM